MRSWLGMAFVVGVAAVLPFGGACYTGPNYGAGNGTGPSAASGEGGVVADGAAAATGLPCDVASMMVRACVECHGATPSRGASYATASYDDFFVRPANDTRNVGEISLARMQNPSDPMPPEGVLPASDVALFRTWVEQGMPRGTCASPPAATATPDGGSPNHTCTSGKYWRDGDEGDERMYPGQACIACHNLEGGDERDDDLPRYTAAGTVYTGLHEPDDCFGRTDVQVLIEGADGVVQTLSVNEAGNFFTERLIALPYRAMVVANGIRRTMKTPQVDGDCNTCHSVAGISDALGRIVAP